MAWIPCVLAGIVAFGESASPARVACMGLIVLGILGLRFTGRITGTLG